MKIVLCNDIDGAFQRSGELARLDVGASGSTAQLQKHARR